MSARVHEIKIQNFKAFRDFCLKLEGRHLLLYGANGSGKSSLYWALYTFLQSAGKSTPDVAKYFDPANSQNLLNIHEQKETTPSPGEISVTIQNADSTHTTYRIGKVVHDTKRDTTILKGNLASDFITYRYFFGFSHFRNSSRFDVWPLFEKEILPFCVSTSGANPLELWNKVKSGNPNPGGSRGQGGASNYRDFDANTKKLAAVLPGIIDTINTAAQTFYDSHFSRPGEPHVRFKLGLTKKPSFTGTNKSNSMFKRPEVEFGVQVDGETIGRPQTFLNEAKMTQLALSVRLATSLVNLRQSDLRLLVLDDLLISLDMSNRMKCIELILTDAEFSESQKIILTHDRGFYEEMRRQIGSAHCDWSFMQLNNSNGGEPRIIEHRDELANAEKLLRNGQFAEAGLQLRKSVEDTLHQFTKNFPETGKFTSLATLLRQAKGIIEGSALGKLIKLLDDDGLDDVTLIRVIPDSNTDLINSAELTDKEKRRCCNRRTVLRNLLRELRAERRSAIAVINEIEHLKDRILNPSAHAGETPLYEQEMVDALDLVRQLRILLPGIADQ